MSYNGFTAVICLLVLMPGSALTTHIFWEFTGGVQGSVRGDGGVGEGVDRDRGDIIKEDVKGDGKGFGRGELRLRYQDSQPGEKAKTVQGRERETQ